MKGILGATGFAIVLTVVVVAGIRFYADHVPPTEFFPDQMQKEVLTIARDCDDAPAWLRYYEAKHIKWSAHDDTPAFYTSKEKQFEFVYSPRDVPTTTYHTEVALRWNPWSFWRIEGPITCGGN